MYYEVKEKKLSLVISGKDKPECVFCGKRVSWNDFYQLCFEHGKIYYTIPKILRVILPKFLVNYILQTIRQQRMYGSDG